MISSGEKAMYPDLCKRRGEALRSSGTPGRFVDRIQLWLSEDATMEEILPFFMTAADEPERAEFTDLKANLLSGKDRVSASYWVIHPEVTFKVILEENNFEPDKAKQCGFEWEGQAGMTNCTLTKGHPKLGPMDTDCHESATPDGHVYDWVPVADCKS